MLPIKARSNPKQQILRRRCRANRDDHSKSELLIKLLGREDEANEKRNRRCDTRATSDTIHWPVVLQRLLQPSNSFVGLAQQAAETGTPQPPVAWCVPASTHQMHSPDSLANMEPNNKTCHCFKESPLREGNPLFGFPCHLQAIPSLQPACSRLALGIAPRRRNSVLRRRARCSRASSPSSWA